jgi:hypothetical protein
LTPEQRSRRLLPQGLTSGPPVAEREGNMRRIIPCIAGGVAAFALVLSGAAGAAAVPVTGTITSEPLVCDFAGGTVTGQVFRFHCDGTETWSGGLAGTGSFEQEFSLNLASGEILAKGTETFVGCLGVRCGTLDWEFQGSGKFDLQTNTLISGHGEQHFTGGSGDLSGASGSVRFTNLSDTFSTYEGSVVL